MSSAGGRAAKHVGIDRDRDSDMSRPSTLRDHGSSAGDGGNHEADEERMQAQKNMQMVSGLPFRIFQHSFLLFSCSRRTLKV